MTREFAMAGLREHERDCTHGKREPRPAPITGTVGDYEGLKGAAGRDRYFRPDRYLRSEFGPVGLAVELTHREQHRRCELVDVSQNGVAFVWPFETAIDVGTILPELAIKFDEHEAYRGEARVSSVRRENGIGIIGASLADTPLDIEDVLHLRDVKSWAGTQGKSGLGLGDGAWRTPGQQSFKALVGELRLLLEDGREKLGDLEASLPWHVAHGEQESSARDALIERVQREFATEVIERSNELDAAFRLAGPNECDALREYSTRHLHHLLMQSPFLHRARHKPLGYPGDYEMMNGLYGNHFAGATLFAKGQNLAFVNTPTAIAVRTRKDLLKHEIGNALAASSGARPVRVLSIAAGPAQEIFELLEELDELPAPLDIVLFDQDKRALSFSHRRLQRLVSTKWKGLVSLLYLNDSIRRLLRGTAVFAGHGTFDLVYSCGLFDYLQRPSAVSLCRSLYALLSPGGRLCIGNMVPSCPTRWLMELHLDWFLIFRESSELLEIGRSAAPGAPARIIEEPTGVNPFLMLQKE